MLPNLKSEISNLKSQIPNPQSLIPPSPVLLRLFQPDLRVASVQELSLPRLRALGLDALLLDADCTIKRYRSHECVPEAAQWLAELGPPASGCAWSPTAWKTGSAASPRGRGCRLSPRP